MASNIDPANPPHVNPTTAGVRANFQAAKTEIEALQAATAAAADQLAGTAEIPAILIGDQGTEGGGINVAGTVYPATAKISDIGGANPAQHIIHRHSLALAPLTLSARSNSDTDAHADVINGMTLYSHFAAGYAGANYKIFGSWQFKARTAGAISNTSAPGEWSLSLTPENAIWPVDVFQATSETLAALVPLTVPAGAAGLQVPNVDDMDAAIAEAIAAIPPGAVASILVSDRKAIGVHAGTSVVGEQQRTLNTVISNNITGASLAGNAVTLPAGTYAVRASAPAHRSNATRLSIRNNATNALIALGESAYTGSDTNMSVTAILDGVFVLAVQTAVRLTQYFGSGYADYGLGGSTPDGYENVYSNLLITKIA